MPEHLMFFLLLSMFLPHTLAVEAQTCLANAVAPGDRRPVVGKNGAESKLKIWRYSWASADIAGSIASIIASEVLGYDVLFEGGGDNIVVAGFYALAGCSSPASSHVDPGCDAEVEKHRFHVVVEAWENTFLSRVEVIKDDPSRMPVRLGAMGYSGVETMYVLGEIRNTVYSSRGLALEYFLTYDPDWNNPAEFFDSVTSIPSRKLKRCNDTMLVEAADTQAYVAFSSDNDGVEIGPSGRLQARCWHDSWWFSPSCRDEPSKCVPVITGGTGWFLHSLMSAATKFRMPLALATAADYATYLEMPSQYKTLLYWWTPDTAFVDQAPIPIIFPPVDSAGWSSGMQYISSATPLSNWGAPDLSQLARDVHLFLQRFSLENNQITEMLSEWKANISSWDVACSWVRRHQETWELWVPDATSCTPGSGLVDALGTYVTSREAAQGCAPCDIGFIEQEVIDDRGRTMICQACAAGTSQLRYGDKQCTICAPGTYTDRAGQSRCEKCVDGTYVSLVGATRCISCPGTLTTAGAGSVEVAECICPAGTFARGNATFSAVCERCPPGLSCATGSSMMNIPACGEPLAQPVSGFEWPKPLPQHFVTCHEPLSAFLCLNPSACPGGALEACAGGFVGKLCATCDKGLYDSGTQCLRCSERSALVQLLPFIFLSAVPALVLAVHKAVSKAYADLTEQLRSARFDFRGSIFYMVILFLQVAAKSLDIFRAASEKPTMWGMLSYTLDFNWIFQMRCWVTWSFETSFAFRATFPAHVVLVFASCYWCGTLFSKLPGGQQVDWNVAVGNFGNLMVVLGVPHLQEALSIFRCYAHPNGRYSLLSAPEVECYDARWTWLASVSVVLVVGFYGPMLAALLYVVRHAPTKTSQPGFRARWRFVLVRFRSQRLWFIFAILGRASCVSIATSVSTSPVLQFFWLYCTCTVYFMLVAVSLPWKRHALNMLDLWMSASMLAALTLVFAAASPLAGECRASILRYVDVAFVAPIVLGVSGALIYDSRSSVPQDVGDMCAAFSVLGDRETLISVLHSLSTTDLAFVKAASLSVVHDLSMRPELADRFRQPAGIGLDWPGWRSGLPRLCSCGRRQKVAVAPEVPEFAAVPPQPLGISAPP